MTAGRIAASILAALVWVSVGHSAETYSLVETVQAGDHFQYRLEMKLTGEMRFTKDDKPATMKLTAAATHVFPERILAVAAGGQPEKVARRYETAKTVITAGEKSERGLRDQRKLIVAQRAKGEGLTYCPAGPLTREEMETCEHFDTLALVGLLPGKPVTVGDSWKVSSDAAQALCAFEGLTSQELTCKLEEVKSNLARVSVTGPAQGIVLGALVKMRIDASYQFDLGLKRLTALEWKETDDRDQGPVSPAMTVESTTTVKRAAIDPPATLDDVALVSVPSGMEPPAPLTQVYYRDSKSRFDLVHERNWRVVGATDKHFFLRLLDRGDFITQATITPWTKAEAGEHLTAEEFQKAMSETPGWDQGEVLQAGVVPTPTEPGRWVYRISALGEMDGVKVMQNFYLIAGPSGDQVVVVFTMTPKQAEKLGSKDLSLVGSLEVPASKPDAEKTK